MEKKPGIHAGHRKRVKSQFLQTDGFYMEEHQLLELALFYCLPRQDTNPLAHRLLHRFGSLSGVLCASEEALSSVQGVSVNTVALLKLLDQLITRHRQGPNAHTRNPYSARALADSLRPCVAGAPDKICILSLDREGRRLALDYQDGMGSTCPQVDIRNLMLLCARNRAAELVLAMSRTGGWEEPTLQDVEMAQRCELALATLSVRLRDVLLFTGSECISLRRLWLLH